MILKSNDNYYDNYYDDVKRLNPQQIKLYLLLNEWILYHTYPDQSGSLWIKKDVHVRLIHNAYLYDDYGDMMRELVETVAKVENCNPREIINLINLNDTISNESTLKILASYLLKCKDICEKLCTENSNECWKCPAKYLWGCDVNYENCKKILNEVI